MSEECFVYVIAIDDLGLSKIGISDSPRTRLRQLSTGSPFKMRIALTISMPTRELARSIEETFHKEASHLRKNGEWFGVESQKACEFMAFMYASWAQYVLGEEPDDIAKTLSGVPPASLLSSIMKIPRHGNVRGAH